MSQTGSIEKGKQVQKLIQELIQEVSIKFPKKWETYAKKILAGDTTITDDEKIVDLYRRIKRLEEDNLWNNLVR
jgi:hypothetical protein